MQPPTVFQKGLFIGFLVFCYSCQAIRVYGGVNIWTSIGPWGGSISALAIDPETPTILYAGTPSGVFKSTNSGENWIPVNTGMQNTFVSIIAIDPASPATLYAGTGSGIFKSTNGGENWSPANTGLGDTSAIILAIDPETPTTLYAGTSCGVFKSTNGGENWSPANTGLTDNTTTPSIEVIVIDPKNTATLYAYGNRIGFFKSMNRGDNWIKIDTYYNSIRVLAIDPKTPTILFAGTQDGLFKSTNGGDSWTSVITGLTNTYVLTLTIDPVTPATLYAGTLNGVFKSTNSGENWIPVNNGMQNTFVSTIAIDPAMPATLYAGTENGVFQSTNGGENWTSVITGLANTYVNALAIDQVTPATLYVTSLYGMYKTTTGGTNWTAVNNGLPDITSGTYYDIAIDPVMPNIIYLGTSRGVYKSTDSGGEWTLINNDLNTGDLAIDPKTPTTLYAGTGGGVIKSTNGGENWSAVNTGLPVISILFSGLAVDPVTPGLLYAIERDRVFKTMDGGDNWALVNSGLNTPDCILNNVYSFIIDPLTPNNLYAATDCGLFKSTNGGENWSAVNTSFYGGALAIDPTNPAILYIGTNDGVYKSIDRGENWGAINNGLGTETFTYPVHSLAIDPKTSTTLYAMTGGATIFKTINGGDNWTAIDTGLDPGPDQGPFSLDTVVIDPVTPDILYTWSSLVINGIFKSTNGGISWTPVNISLGSFYISTLAIAPGTPASLYAGTPNGIIKSTDGGDHWTPINNGLTDTNVIFIIIDPVSPTTLFAGTPNGIFKSTNNGENWNPVNNKTTFCSSGLGSFAFDLVNPATIYGLNQGGVYKSTNAGDNWILVNNNLDHFIEHPHRLNRLLIDPRNPAILYLGMRSGSNFISFGAVFRSANGGGYWSQISKFSKRFDDDVIELAIDPVNPTTLYAVTPYDGVFKSTDSGNHWTSFNNGLDSFSRTAVTSLAIDAATPSTLYAGTQGRGVLAITQIGASYILTVSPSGTGNGKIVGNGIDCYWNGSLSGGICSVIVAENTEVNLMASPDPGSIFSGWSGGTGSAVGCSGMGVCTFNITANSGVGPRFALENPTYPLTVNPSGSGSGKVIGNGIDCNWNGSVSSGICSVDLAENTAVSLNASAVSGSDFNGWKVGGGSASGCSGIGVCAFSITEASWVNPRFSLENQTYLLTVNPFGTGSGSIIGNGIDCYWNGNAAGGTCSVNLPEYAAVNLTAWPGFSSIFNGWMGEVGSAMGCSGTGACMFEISMPSVAILQFTLGSHIFLPLIIHN